MESNIPAREGSLQRVAQLGIQHGWEYLHRRRLPHLSGQLVPVLCHSDRKVIPHVCAELPMFQFPLLPLVLLLQSSEESLPPSQQCSTARLWEPCHKCRS